jgi:tRNA (guanine-N7-)-methyltransferase
LKKQGKNIYDVILACNQEDENKNLDFDFSFLDKINFEKLIKNVSTKSLVRDNYFVHIEDIFIIENKENSGLLQVTFGNFDRPVSKYIIIENKKAAYFQDLPIPTSSNIKAHNELKEMLK